MISGLNRVGFFVSVLTMSKSVRVSFVVFLAVSLGGCGTFSIFDYLATGLRFASRPAELVEKYYAKIDEDRQLALERENRLMLKEALDLQECGAVYFWLDKYYARHGGLAAKEQTSLADKYKATGIDRNFLERVIYARVGDGRAMKTVDELPDLHWVMHNKRLCDEIYIDRLVSNPQFERPLAEPALYEVDAR